MKENTFVLRRNFSEDPEDDEIILFLVVGYSFGYKKCREVQMTELLVPKSTKRYKHFEKEKIQIYVIYGVTIRILLKNGEVLKQYNTLRCEVSLKDISNSILRKYIGICICLLLICHFKSVTLSSLSSCQGRVQSV